MAGIDKRQELRRVIQEGLRVQRGGPESVEYVDVSSSLADIGARQNHVVFGRRGCGKTLLLQAVEKAATKQARIIYINCEDYKQHSFPNVLIEILDQVFDELERNLTGWFGKKHRSRQLITEIRKNLVTLKEKPDAQTTSVKEVSTSEIKSKVSGGVAVEGIKLGASEVAAQKNAIEHEYQRLDSKIQKLNLLLPKLKEQIREFFELSSDVKTLFVEVDDFYHLPRTMQPHVADYIHRLCKDVSIYFKIATLRHASVLYADRGSQPTGAQERHDYQPINIDFTLAEFQKTSDQLWQILSLYANKAAMTKEETDGLFVGGGFSRLVLAAGGVPRDFLSLLLDVLSRKQPTEGIGKDDVRLLSLAVFQRRIEELKADSEPQEQDALLRGIYAIRGFCSTKKANVFLVSDTVLQSQNGVRDLLNRLLDYRIIHSVGSALTHKTQPGTYHAYMIDIGAYANLRKLVGRFDEIDVTARDARERCRNAPVLDEATLMKGYRNAPAATESALLATESETTE
ncbi:MAG: hypothetical protein HYW49_06595 [Deltaproteobacteria bacterium]|nr:hypothetical protein [Deltaproteobacteria bacterium]